MRYEIECDRIGLKNVANEPALGHSPRAIFLSPTLVAAPDEEELRRYDDEMSLLSTATTANLPAWM